MEFPIVTALLWSVLAQVEVSQTDRAPYSARLLSISANSVELAEESTGQNRPVATDKLRTLRFAPPAAKRPRDAGGTLRVKLIDESQFSCAKISSADGSSQFTFPAGRTLSVPTQQLAWVQLQPLNDLQTTQWQAIMQSRLSADALVLIRSAEALEKLEGIVLSIGDQSVGFDFGGQRIDAPLAKLAGVRWLATGRATESLGKLSAIVTDWDGSRWMASELRLPEDAQELQLKLQCGATVDLPVERIQEIDFSSGSMKFLADLQPISRESTKRLDLGVKIPGADVLFGSHKSDDRDLGSVSLGPSLQFLGSGSSVYRIPAGFSRLIGAVQLKPTGSRYSPCRVTVKLENEVIWQERLAETSQRLAIDLPIVAEQRLRLEVDAEAAVPVGDIVIWHDLRFVK